MGNILSPESGPLFHAIAKGDVDAAVRAVEAHPGLSHKRAGKKSRTIYHACASSGQVAILRRLCEHVWQNMPDEMGKMHAPDVLPEDRFHPMIYRAVNSYDECGLTPLMLSCRKGHAGAVQYLLSQVSSYPNFHIISYLCYGRILSQLPYSFLPCSTLPCPAHPLWMSWSTLVMVEARMLLLLTSAMNPRWPHLLISHHPEAGISINNKLFY